MLQTNENPKGRCGVGFWFFLVMTIVCLTAAVLALWAGLWFGSVLGSVGTVLCLLEAVSVHDDWEWYPDYRGGTWRRKHDGYEDQGHMVRRAFGRLRRSS